MLTKQEKERLNSKIYVAEHLQYFCQHWSNRDDCPQHFEDMMRRFVALKPKEQMKFYVIDDTLYTVEQVTEKYQLLNPNNNRYHKHPRGWYKTT